MICIRKTVILKVCFSSLLLWVHSIGVVAQKSQTIGETDIRPFAVSGNLSLISEGYAIQGIESRRPPGMGMINLNTTFNIMGLQSGINVLYSTDDNKLRQSMNQFNFQANWRWLRVTAGTVSPRFSKYSLSGVPVTGGLIEINPGRFSLALTGGRSKRPVSISGSAGFRQPAYERWIYASRIGFGRKEGSGFAITGLYAHDMAGSAENPGDLLPAESFNLSPELQLSLFQDKLTLQSNVSFALFTRDQSSTSVELTDIEELESVTNLIEPKSSSRVDYAGEVSGRINFGLLRLNGTYERIQPGFRSLGLGHIRSDQEQYRMRAQLRMFKGKANMSAMYNSGRNNLLNTRISSLMRRQISSNLSVRIAQKLNVNLSYMNMLNMNEPVNKDHTSARELHSSLLSQNFMLSPSMMLQKNNISHSVSLTSSFQTLTDESKMVLANERPASEFESLTFGFNYGANLPNSLSFNIAGNLMHNTTPASTSIGNSLNLSGGYAFFDRKLSSNLSVGWSRNGIEFVRIITYPDQPGIPEETRIRYPANKDNPNGNGLMEGEYLVEHWSQQYSMNLSLGYRFKNNNTLRLTARGLLSRPQHEEGRHFNEMHATLRYQHRF